MNFSIKATDVKCNARSGLLKTDHGFLQTPIFMPVGTVGAVKTFSPNELEDLGSQIILGNTYHLYLRPGTTIINKAGGLHSFISWKKPILTDSGGFQVFSLARLNKISEDGVEFQSHIDGSRHMFTPELSMKIQRKLGSDIIMAFDYCPSGEADLDIIKIAVKRTTSWMKRCHEWCSSNPEFYNFNQVLYPIIQGGVNIPLRKQSFEELVPFATCGMAIGGLAVGEEKEAMFDTVEFCCEIMPKDQPRYLMGVGKPTDLIRAVYRGVDMFDCVMPTRNGRNGHVFTSNGVINIKNQQYKNDFSPLDPNSSHDWGRLFSKAYIRHLFNINEILGIRIASTLNLAYYQHLMKIMREKINQGEFYEWSKLTLKQMKSLKGM